jgi:hypothetical protein
VDTTAPATASKSPDRAADGDEGTSYRTLSILALASLLLGLAAPLCLAAPLLMVIPVCGAVLGIAAVLRIDASDGAMVGRTAALVGLGLSVASICAAYTRTSLTQTMLSAQARSAGEQFVQLLHAGDVDKAFELTLAHAQGPPPKPPQEKGGPPAEPPPDPFETFRTNPVVISLTKLGPEAKIRFERDLAFAPGARDEYSIAEQYLVTGDANAGGSSLPLRLTMLRIRPSRLTNARWVVERYERDSALPLPTSEE